MALTKEKLQQLFAAGEFDLPGGDWDSITGKPTSFPTTWALVSGKPTTFPPSSHGNHVPATQTANNAVFLRNDNTWQTVTPANIGAAPTSHTHTDFNSYLHSITETDFNHLNKYGLQVRYLRVNASNKPTGMTDGVTLAMSYSSSWTAQMAIDYRTNEWYVRGQKNDTWLSWQTLLHTGNYSTYTVPKTGASYIQSAGLCTSWGITDGTSTGALNTIMGTASGATWLITGTSNGVFRGGLQLKDTGSRMRLYVLDKWFEFIDWGDIITSYGKRVYHSGNITSGTASPSGGVDGDIYIQYW